MNVVDLSERAVNEVFMAGLLDDDAEGHARLSGLLAVIALPPIHHGDGTVRKRTIEIETAPGGPWVSIEGIAVEMHRVICWTGTNGSRRQYEFPRGAAIPRWRVPSMNEHPPVRYG